MDYHAAHKFSSVHREQVAKSELCGCFYCLEIYSPSKITEWVDNDDAGMGQTALCPRCGIDSVIGSNSGVPITKEYLTGMNLVWF